MGSLDAFDRVVASLQEAALGHADWPEAACLISEVSRTQGSALVLFGGHTQIDGDFFYTQFCLRGEVREDLKRKYLEDYFPQDERVPRILHLPHGQLVDTGDLYTDREKKTSRAYNEALRHVEGQNGLHMRLDGPEESHVVWALCDSTERGGWGSDQVRMIERLQPHVRQFVVVRQALAEAGALGASLGALLESTRFGLIQLNRDGRIVEANDLARRLLGEGNRLADQRGFLRVRVPAENAELSRLLDCALPPFGTRSAAGSMMVGRSSSRGPLILHISPVGEQQPQSQPRRVAAFVLVLDPATPAPIDPVLVATALGLTTAESQLAVALAAGQTVRDIALSTGRTEQTVRWHMKQIFRKQGISRQVDLVRRVLMLGGAPASIG
ncbi:helix-turn-helix transcriptional regulator [Candidatus Palauibacter sp.]|uniref:helix-turn-helix transcriptional regulator n=1 Tax=Candidatus Palauibacter sp. TaxID=3101350 RepID=UPI003AF2D174